MNPGPDTWQEALTRRLRTLIRTAPLHRLEAAKGYRGDAFGEQDLRAIALRVLDVVIERMGLGVGATFEDVREALRPLVRAADPSLDPEAGDVVIDTVVLGLLNERERRQAFAERYLALSGDQAVEKELQFHLLRERETAEGGTVLVATVEGINLHAGMLDYPVEDAQIAEEAVLHAQVQRGRIADAVRTAQRARLRSIEYEQKIVGLIETVRRDVDRVDWVAEVLDLLTAARQHVSERLAAERLIERAVEDRLDHVAGETALSLVALRDALVECIGRHVRLHRRLMEANRRYLEEQERQAFRPPSVARLPDLEADVLHEAAALTTGDLAELADGLLARLTAPTPPKALRLTHLIDRLLAPRRNEAEEAFEIADAELEALAPPARSFDDADRARVDAFLADVIWPTRLGALLESAVDAGLGAGALHLLALRTLRIYDPGARSELFTTPPEHVRVVGQVLAWRGQRRSADHGNLRRLFFSLRAGALGFDELPIHGLGEPAESFDAFRSWLREVSHEHAAQELIYTENQTTWLGHLDDVGLDPELFRYQLRMNQREGAADEMFRFTRDVDFVRFLIELALTPKTADAIAQNLLAQQENLRMRPTWSLERRFVSEAIGHVERLAADVHGLSAAETELGRATHEVAGLTRGLSERAEASALSAGRAREAAAEAREEGRLASNLRDLRQRWSRGLSRLALTYDEAEAKAALTDAEARLEALRSELAGPRGFDVKILKPDTVLRPEPVPLSMMSTFSRGQQLTAAILLYCTLVQLRARTRGRGRGGEDAGVLILDNPIGTCSNVALLRLQRSIAERMRVQLVYTTGVDDLDALATLPNKIRLRNTHRDRATGHYHVTAEEGGSLEAVRLVEVPPR